ncbi:MAG: hypothetical protein HKO58_06855, partial [Gammaproteobacteria bacterium]|nr:hypothetical protein [Gammaproteobacteria bacterium]
LEIRISEGISEQNHEITQDAMRVGVYSIAVLVHLARSYEPKTIKIVATSSVRDAINSLEFVESVKKTTGLQLDVLSGIEEATFIGKGLRGDPLIADIENFIQMDIGGGSLELIRLSKDSIEEACSLQLGAVRLTEKFVLDRALAITSETETKIKDHVLRSVEDSGFHFEPSTDPMTVTGGAFSVIRSILAAQSGEMIDTASPVIYKNDIIELKKTLCNLSLDERKTIPGLPAARADVMPTALITIDAVLERSGRDTVTQSSCNLRYGTAAALLAES